MELKEKTIRQINYIKGRAFDIEFIEVELPNKKHSRRDILHHAGASAVLAIDANGDIIMVRQYRKALECDTIEIPAGKIDLDEDPETCAVRELEEETGYLPQEMHFIMKFASAVGFSDEIIYIYFATELKQSIMHCDEDEFLQVEKYNIEQVMEMIKEQKIIDGKTIAACQWYYINNILRD